MDSVSWQLGEDKADLTAGWQALTTAVETAARVGEAAHVVEHQLFKGLLSLGQQLLGYFFKLQGDGDRGACVAGPQGTPLKRSRERHDRRYVSVFGEFSLSRWVYAQRAGQRIEDVPFDARLQLPESDFSYLLQNWSQLLSVQMPYRQTAEVLNRLLGLSVGVSALERINAALAASVESYRDVTPASPSPEGDCVVVSADGKGIPIHQASAEAVIKRHDRHRGPKPDRKRMAVLGTVYDAKRYPRTVDQVWQSLFASSTPAATQAEEADSRPEPIAKQLRGNLPQVAAAGHVRNAREPVFDWITEQVEQRDPGHQKPVVVLMDGQHCLWEDIRNQLPEDHTRIEILDLLHATSKLWDLVHIFHPSGSQPAHRAMAFCTRVLLLGQIQHLTVWLRDQTQTRPPADRQRVETICGYFDHHQERMHYAAYLAAGYPIASGVIEGACRHVVRDRMERSGMRWCLTSAQAMLDLRCVYLNGQWDEFTDHRIQQENSRRYPNLQAGVSVEWPMVA